MKLLIIEDERQLANALKEIMIQNKFTADIVYDGEDGLYYALSNIYDAIILDIMLPKMDGIEVLRRLRQKNVTTPLLFLSAKSDIQTKVEGLNIGADDYLTKPFLADEIVARVKAITRRKGAYVDSVIKYKDVSLDKSNYELSCGNQKTKLGMKEYQIMETLLYSQNRIINRECLINKIWGYDSDAEYNTIEVYISFLRKKLIAIGSTVQIKSIRGIGYNLES